MRCGECDRVMEDGEMVYTCKRCGVDIGGCCRRPHWDMCALPTPISWPNAG